MLPGWAVLLNLKVAKQAQQQKKLKGYVMCKVLSYCLVVALQGLMHWMTRWAWHHEKLVTQLETQLGQKMVQLRNLTRQLGYKVRGVLKEMQGLVVLGWWRDQVHSDLHCSRVQRRCQMSLSPVVGGQPFAGRCYQPLCLRLNFCYQLLLLCYWA